MCLWDSCNIIEGGLVCCSILVLLLRGLVKGGLVCCSILALLLRGGWCVCAILVLLLRGAGVFVRVLHYY